MRISWPMNHPQKSHGADDNKASLRFAVTKVLSVFANRFQGRLAQAPQLRLLSSDWLNGLT
jgi:hypothetical protein